VRRVLPAAPRDFTGVLKREEITISMDGKGCWRGNVFVERLRRSNFAVYGARKAWRQMIREVFRSRAVRSLG